MNKEERGNKILLAVSCVGETHLSSLGKLWQLLSPLWLEKKNVYELSRVLVCATARMNRNDLPKSFNDIMFAFAEEKLTGTLLCREAGKFKHEGGRGSALGMQALALERFALGEMQGCNRVYVFDAIVLLARSEGADADIVWDWLYYLCDKEISHES